MLFKSTINETFQQSRRATEERCSSRKKGGTMGKKDVVSKIYLGAADRIADLLNNELLKAAVPWRRQMSWSWTARGEHTERGRQYR